MSSSLHTQVGTNLSAVAEGEDLEPVSGGPTAPAAAQRVLGVVLGRDRDPNLPVHDDGSRLGDDDVIGELYSRRGESQRVLQADLVENCGLVGVRG